MSVSVDVMVSLSTAKLVWLWWVSDLFDTLITMFEYVKSQFQGWG